jgi:SLOG in TRPM, prokaryote/SMODS and SLOG-associating 2TM effector domain 1/Protein of unknown function (DUF4231)
MMDRQQGERGDGVLTLEFANGNRAVAVKAGRGKHPSELLGALGLAVPSPLLLLVGGANTLDQTVRSDLADLLERGVVRAASASSAVVVDGGTAAGVMALMGEAVAEGEARVPLLGVAPAGKVTYPGDGQTPPPDSAELEANHSHFVLANSNVWGGETSLLLELVETLAEGRSAVVVLAGGGPIVRDEIFGAVRRNLPVVMIEGTGGFADTLVAALADRRSHPTTPLADPALEEIVTDGTLTTFPLGGDPIALARLLTRQLQEDQTLRMAWHRFSMLDKTANRKQTAFRLQQRWILGLGVAATTLVVVQGFLRANDVLARHPLLASSLHVVIVAVPIVVAALVAAAARFRPGSRWVVLRGSAEAIKREIYRYRARAGAYSNAQTRKVSREAKLAEAVGSTMSTVMRTDINRSALEAYDDAEGLPPQGGAAEGDDGMSPLSPTRYLELRIDDQIRFYERRVRTREFQVRRLRWAMLGLGGLGTFLAAIGLELWIAVTIALVGAFTTYLEAMQLENTLMLYNQAATDLAVIKAWWLALPPDEQFRQETIDRLVTRAERIMRAELTGWVQEMQDAMTQLRLEQQTRAADSDQSAMPAGAGQPGKRPAPSGQRAARHPRHPGKKQSPHNPQDGNGSTTP